MIVHVITSQINIICIFEPTLLKKATQIAKSPHCGHKKLVRYLSQSKLGAYFQLVWDLQDINKKIFTGLYRQTLPQCLPTNLQSIFLYSKLDQVNIVHVSYRQSQCNCKFSLTQGPGRETRCNRLFQHLSWLACCGDLSAAGLPANTSLLTAVLQLAVYYCGGPRFQPPRRW